MGTLVLYRVEVMTGTSVVSTILIMADLPFKAAEAHVGQPVTFRRNQENWLRVTDTRAEERTFAYVVRSQTLLSPNAGMIVALGACTGSEMAGEYLNHQLECPYCGTIRLRIPKDAQPSTEINCSDCGQYLGTWDEIQSDFERQGGAQGIFRLEKGRIKKLD